MDTWKRAEKMQVVSLKEGAIVGRLDDFQFDLESRQIYGWRLKGLGMFSKAGGTPAARITQIGADVAFITSESDVEWSGIRAKAVVGRAWASGYIGMSVMSRRGTVMGAVKDFVIDVQADVVTSMILHGNRLLVLDEQVQTGSDVIIVRSSDILIDLPEEEQREPWWARVRDALRARRSPPQLEAPPSTEG
ncbi:MAG: PRC-barrel domain-containing protein [Myxococcota bacterium]